MASVAAGARHTAVLKSDGSVLILGDCAAAPSGLANVLSLAAGDRFTVALKNDGNLVAWGDNASGQTNIPAGLTNIQTMACGPSRTVALPYTSVLSYPVDVRKDFLVLYNTNSVGSTGVKNYYLANRRGVANANVLGVSAVESEVMNATNFNSQVLGAIASWQGQNLTKRPRFVMLSWGLP